jgi:hypothetical protein
MTHLIIVDPNNQCRRSRAAHGRVALDLRRRRADGGKIRKQRRRVGRLDYCQDKPHDIFRLETSEREAPPVASNEPP